MRVGELSNSGVPVRHPRRPPAPAPVVTGSPPSSTSKAAPRGSAPRQLRSALHLGHLGRESHASPARRPGRLSARRARQQTASRDGHSTLHSSSSREDILLLVLAVAHRDTRPPTRASTPRARGVWLLRDNKQLIPLLLGRCRAAPGSRFLRFLIANRAATAARTARSSPRLRRPGLPRAPPPPAAAAWTRTCPYVPLLQRRGASKQEPRATRRARRAASTTSSQRVVRVVGAALLIKSFRHHPPARHDKTRPPAASLHPLRVGTLSAPSASACP